MIHKLYGRAGHETNNI